jgi:phenylacetate-CoA ligase
VLRPSLEFSADASDDEVVLFDRTTGLRLSLSREAADVLQALGSTGGQTTVDPEVEAFVQEALDLGLDASLPEHEVLRRQGAFVRRQAEELIFPRVAHLVREAAARAPFHARLAGSLDALRSAADLPRLAPMTRADLRGAFPEGLVPAGFDLQAALERRDVLLARTSGSSGERLQVISDTRLPRFPDDYARWWGLPPFDEGYLPRTAVFTTPLCAGPICHLGKSPMADRIEAEATLYLNSTEDLFALDPALAHNVVGELWAFRPDFLFVNPVYLTVLLRKTEQLGLTLPPIRAVVSSYQPLLRGLRRRIEQSLHCPVIDFYSATELGGSIAAVQCRHGALHVRLDQVFAEIVDAQGRPTVAGALGELLLTTFNPVLPLVRYQVGDLARWVEAPCPCEKGSHWPRLQIEGRARDTLVVRGEPLTPWRVDELLGPLPWLELYQLREQAGGFELQVVAAPGANVHPEQAAAALGPALDGKLRVRVVDLLRPEPGQKYRSVCPAGNGWAPSCAAAESER